jgi:adenylate cyclase
MELAPMERTGGMTTAGRNTGDVLQRIGLALLIVLVVAGGSWAGLGRSWFSGWRSWSTDAVFPRGEPDERILVVGIDSDALAQQGRWPWDRSTLARLVDRLADAGARTVVLDVVLDSPQPDDGQLVAAMARVPTVLAWFPQVQRYDATLDVIASDPTTAVEPVDALREAAAALGHSVVGRSPVDRVTRRVPLVIDDGISFRPSLALAGLAVATGVSTDQIILQPDAVQLGDKAIPVAARHQLTINYTDGFTAPGSPGYVSAADLLGSGALPPELVERMTNRLVLVGVADENLGDQELTPLSSAAGQPGVSVHANALDTMLQDTYLQEPTRGLGTAITTICALIIAMSTLLLGLRAGFISTIACVVGVFTWSILPAASSGRLIDVVFPWLGALLAFGLGVALRYLVADRQRRRASELFRQYVPASVSNELLRRGLLDEQVAGVRVELSTMFCDLRGFTAMTHELGPQVLRNMLNHYYEYATAIVEKHNGTLMQFVGDEVYAVFGAPLPSPTHHAQAVACAMDLVSNVAQLDTTLQSHGFPTIRFGVGVATGSAIAAHVGSQSRRQYTVVGDAVNLGARLCSQAKADQVVASEPVAAAADVVTLANTYVGLTVNLEALTLKGFAEPYPVRRISFNPVLTASTKDAI